MRGTRNSLHEELLGPRFIPARAGNTPPRVPRNPAGPVHPRACGEHTSIDAVERDRSGSSPRVRGTQEAAYRSGMWFRFIPARAGNTRSGIAGPARRSVHPRACGEHPTGLIMYDMRAGSSPRVRGTRMKRARSGRPLRFIPARAGNTGLRGSQPRNRTVHPRACGEHGRAKQSPSTATGSSPRVRGTP